MNTADSIPEQFLWCRDVGHRWDPYDASLTRNKVTRRREIHRQLLCEHCSTLRTDALAANGDVLRRSYSYPDGYLLTQQHSLTPADRSMIRKINTRYAFEQDQPKKAHELTQPGGHELTESDGTELK